jgi:hypothetical protein
LELLLLLLWLRRACRCAAAVLRRALTALELAPVRRRRRGSRTGGWAGRRGIALRWVLAGGRGLRRRVVLRRALELLAVTTWLGARPAGVLALRRRVALVLLIVRLVVVLLLLLLRMLLLRVILVLMVTRMLLIVMLLLLVLRSSPAERREAERGGEQAAEKG